MSRHRRPLIFVIGSTLLTLAPVFFPCAGPLCLAGEGEADRETQLKEAKELLAQAATLYRAARFDDAIPLVKRALDIHAKVLGADDPDTAETLNNLGLLYDNVGAREKAESLYRRSLQVKEEKLGPDHQDTATTLNNLALLYHRTGAYHKAEPLYTRALQIWEERLGNDHPTTAVCVKNLAALYKATAIYAKAEPLYLRALKIRKEKLGENHPDTATSLEGLAGLYHSMGNHVDAQTLYMQALKIREEKLGEDHVDTATSLDSLAGLYHSMGNYSHAQQLYLRALKIREEKLGADHPDTADILNDLAALRSRMGDHANAKRLRFRAIRILDEQLGTLHPKTVAALTTTAWTLHGAGNSEKAEALLISVLKLWEHEFGAEHPRTGSAVNNLAVHYDWTGEYPRAKNLYERALSISEAKLGPTHPDTARGIENLAQLLFKSNQLVEAGAHFLRAAEIKLSNRAANGATPLQRSVRDAKEGVSYAVAGAICVNLKLDADADCLQLAERGRATGLRELLAEARARAEAPLADEDRRRVVDALAKITALYRSLEALADNGLPTEDARLELARAEIDYDALLVELAGRYEQFVATESAGGLSSKEAVASAALDDETAVITWHSFENLTWGCVVRRSGVHWADLSELVKEEADREHVRRVRLAGESRSESLPNAAPHFLKLYQTRVQPLEKHLGGIEHLIVIAQEWAAVTPLEILLTGEPPADAVDASQWPWLSNKYRISYTPSMTTLDILTRRHKERRSRGWDRPLFVLGDPPFSEEQLAEMKGETAAPPQLAAAEKSSAVSRAIRYDSAAEPPRLPGTRLEARSVASALAAETPLSLIGENASERRLFELSEAGELSKCRYVHFATHGLVDADRPEFSGLVLARAPADDAYDGVLHMREVFQLKLDADLVVLSACQTGLGKSLGGEGVVGLSTSFFYAGAPSVVMSLWQVDDLATALLMQRLYGNLAKGKPKAESLHEAKTWLRNLTRHKLDDLAKADANLVALSRGFGKPTVSPKGTENQSHPFAHPYYWAAFVLSGDLR